MLLKLYLVQPYEYLFIPFQNFLYAVYSGK